MVEVAMLAVEAVEATALRVEAAPVACAVEVAGRSDGGQLRVGQAASNILIRALRHQRRGHNLGAGGLAGGKALAQLASEVGPLIICILLLQAILVLLGLDRGGGAYG